MKPITQGHIVPFALGGIEAITAGEAMFVSVRHLCEVFGLDFSSQRKKLLPDPKFNCGDMTMVAADGKMRELLTIPLEQVAGFLYSININKVSPDVRQALLDYQDECTKALNDYWTTGKAEQQTLSTQMAFQIADTLAVFKDEYAAIYGKAADAVPHSGLYAKIQSCLNQVVCGADRLPDGLARQALPKVALDRLKDAGKMLRKLFIQGVKLKDAAKQLHSAFPDPVLKIETTVTLA
ncbi:phage antirepressor N-terminal domain-containing protein [Iodobacter sp.]|uniref:phage antirepressor N-terminal domain-containing protein n=1 Tax=Iodobacter sp. TaxID=1915058 RepID=UPI0025F62437|nr:phage antirepressor N-terminal domain-containing protein [Iodobacter sp.]